MASAPKRKKSVTMEGNQVDDWLETVRISPARIPRVDIGQLLPTAMLENLMAIGDAASRLIDEVTRAFEPAFEMFKELSADIERSRRIEASGWLPHYTTPFGLIADEMTAEEIAVVIERHYRDNWEDVEVAFLQRLESTGLDDEAKATFREALFCHRHGQYRSVPRTLFPEIERIACVVLYDGARTYRKDVKEGKIKEFGITSLPDFTEAVGELPIGHVLTTDYGYALYRKLESHLYKTIKRPEDVAAAAVDPVPNRHASLHGIVTYSSMQNSLNALIMTDFVFHLIDSIRSLSGRDARRSK